MSHDFIVGGLEPPLVSSTGYLRQRVAVERSERLPNFLGEWAGFSEALLNRIRRSEFGRVILRLDARRRRCGPLDGGPRFCQIDPLVASRLGEGCFCRVGERLEGLQAEFYPESIERSARREGHEPQRRIDAVESIKLHGGDLVPMSVRIESGHCIWRTTRARCGRKCHTKVRQMLGSHRLKTGYGLLMVAARSIKDQLGRTLSDLRVSVTDRCNFRCTYCMPREKVEGGSFLPKAELLSFEEIAKAAAVFVDLGVSKIRLTGGEPLLRRELPRLVKMLSGLGAELALTTNGVLLPKLAAPLKEAGLHRLTVSLDALDASVFQTICDAPSFGPQDVLAGICAAEDAGFESIKINCAVRRGGNESEVPKIARHFSGTPHIVRFIEFMDVGTRNGWDPSDVVCASEIRALLAEVGELVPVDPNYRGEVARRYKYANGMGEIGIIASVSEPFCGDCTRARMSADGSLYKCLFAQMGYDLRAALRAGKSEIELGRALTDWWEARTDRYSESRAVVGSSEGQERRLPILGSKVEMSFIGG